jgi:hypothetical protein
MRARSNGRQGFRICRIEDVSSGTQRGARSGRFWLRGRRTLKVPPRRADRDPIAGSRCPQSIHRRASLHKGLPDCLVAGRSAVILLAWIRPRSAIGSAATRRRVLPRASCWRTLASRSFACAAGRFLRETRAMRHVEVRTLYASAKSSYSSLDMLAGCAYTCLLYGGRAQRMDWARFEGRHATARRARESSPCGGDKTCRGPPGRSLT